MSGLHTLLRTGTPEQVQKALQELPAGDATAVNAVDDAGFTPLHLAAERASPELVSALLTKGANPNVQTQNGVRAIHLAAKAGNDEVVQMLLKNGANLQPEDHNRATPLHYAAEANQFATSRVLLELGSSVGAENVAKNTAAHIAAVKGFGNLLALLVEHGADLQVPNNDGNTVVALMKLVDSEEEPEVKDSTLASDLRTLVNSPAHSDVHFKLADGVLVHAHKTILAARCPHWRSRLQQEPSLATVEAKDHKREVLLAALEFVYSGDTKILHEAAEDPHRPFLLLDLALYAYSWQLPVLAKLAESRIHKALTLVNAVPLFLRLVKTGDSLHASVLRQVASYILKNGTKVSEFQSLNRSHILRALNAVKLEARPVPPVKSEHRKSLGNAVPDSPMADVPTGGVPLADDSPGALSAARNIVLNMMKEKMAWPFNVPVDPIKLGIPDYPLHIKHPMDLGTIKKKFKNYTRSSDLAADVRLTFRNALTYNQAGSDIALFAMNLLLMFESQMEKAGVTLPPMSSELATLVEATKNARLNPPPPMALAPPPLASPPPPKAAQPKKRKTEGTPTAAAPTPRPPAPAARAAPVDSDSSSEDDGKEMTIDEKRQLGAMIEKLNPDQLEQVMDIMNVKENEVEVDIMDLDQITLRKLRAYVNQCLGVGKKKHDKDRNYVPKPKKNKHDD